MAEQPTAFTHCEQTADRRTIRVDLPWHGGWVCISKAGDQVSTAVSPVAIHPWVTQAACTIALNFDRCWANYQKFQ